MSTSRLRKTFRYPADSDSDSDPELDEQDQEHLISTLQSHDSSSTAFYRRAFLPLPLLAALVYLPLIFNRNSPRRHILLSFLSLTALAGTAYVLYCVPLAHERDRKNGKRPMYAAADARGPVDRYLAALVAALSAVVALAAVVAWRKGFVDEAWRGVLPGGACLLAELTTEVDDAVVELITFSSSYILDRHVCPRSDGSSGCRGAGTAEVQLQGCLNAAGFQRGRTMLFWPLTISLFLLFDVIHIEPPPMVCLPRKTPPTILD